MGQTARRLLCHSVGIVTAVLTSTVHVQVNLAGSFARSLVQVLSRSWPWLHLFIESTLHQEEQEEATHMRSNSVVSPCQETVRNILN